MDYLPLVVSAIVVFAIAAAYLKHRNRRTPSNVREASTPEAIHSQSVVPVGTIDMDSLLSAIEWPNPQGQEPVLIDMEDGTALVLGDRSQALSLGEVIAESGPRLVSASRHLSSATEAAVRAAEQTGHLVRLHPDSVKAFKELKPDQVKDAAGFVYATLRGSKGRYRHVVRLKDVGKLRTLSSGAAIISALAMQAQLDRIEKQLSQVQAAVGEVQRTLDASSRAKRSALDTLFGEIYRTAHETGQLTPAQWTQVAPVISDTYQLREQTTLGLEELVRKIGQLPPKAADRRNRLNELSAEFSVLMNRLDGDDRRVGQAQAIRLWHLAASSDPSLGATLSDTRLQIDERLRHRSRLLAEIEATVGDPDVRSVQRLHTKARYEIRESGFALSHAARERRLALPTRLALGWADPSSPENVALSFTLTADEALALSVSQCWLMSQCAEDESAVGDLERFLRSTVDTIIATDQSVLNASSRSLVREMASAPPTTQASMLSELSTLERVTPGTGSRVRSLLLLIELCSFHPWSPKDPLKPLKSARKWDEKKRSVSIERIASVMDGVAPADAQQVQKATAESVKTLFQGMPSLAVATLLVAGVGAGVLTAGLAAPMIGTAVGGTVFGLYGAAATSAGLAALGGGSLAAGGLGMAGGTAVISAAGGVLGLGVGAGATAGASAATEAQTRVLGRLVADVVKVHVLCKVVLVDELQDLKALDETISGLRNRRDEVRLILASQTRPSAATRGTSDRSPHQQADEERELAADETSSEDVKHLKSLEQALTRGVEDLLKRRGTLIRDLDERVT